MKMTQKDAEHAEQQNVQAVTLWAAADLETEGLERCIQFNVQIVIKNQLYLSYQEETSLSIAVNAMKVMAAKLEIVNQDNNRITKKLTL